MSQEKKHELTFVETLGIAFFAVFVAWYFGPILIETFLGQFWGHNMAGNIRDQDKERFGPEESFAALNTLFSGLALASVAVTLWYQRRDLEEQRHQTKITRKVAYEQIEKAERERQLAAVPVLTMAFVPIYFESGARYTGTYKITIWNSGADVSGVHIFSAESLTPAFCPKLKTDDEFSTIMRFSEEQIGLVNVSYRTAVGTRLTKEVLYKGSVIHPVNDFESDCDLAEVAAIAYADSLLSV